MNYAEFKNYIKESAEEIRCIDKLPKGITFSEKTIVMLARQELYTILNQLLENADKERSDVKSIKTNFHYLP